jgi:hypothetical protein
VGSGMAFEGFAAVIAGRILLALVGRDDFKSQYKLTDPPRHPSSTHSSSKPSQSWAF